MDIKHIKHGTPEHYADWIFKYLRELDIKEGSTMVTLQMPDNEHDIELLQQLSAELLKEEESASVSIFEFGFINNGSKAQKGYNAKVHAHIMIKGSQKNIKHLRTKWYSLVGSTNVHLFDLKPIWLLDDLVKYFLKQKKFNPFFKPILGITKEKAEEISDTMEENTEQTLNTPKESNENASFLEKFIVKIIKKVKRKYRRILHYLKKHPSPS